MADDEKFMDLEIKLAFQERLIRELDALVRQFAERLGTVERDLQQMRAAVTPAVTSEKPPHY